LSTVPAGVVLSSFEVLRKIFGLKTEELAGGWRLYGSTYRMIDELERIRKGAVVV
jgi:hypothetical protein